MYSFEIFKNLRENKELSFENVWMKYNDMVDMEYHEMMLNLSLLNNTINSFVEDDVVEDFIE